MIIDSFLGDFLQSQMEWGGEKVFLFLIGGYYYSIFVFLEFVLEILMLEDGVII